MLRFMSTNLLKKNEDAEGDKLYDLQVHLL